MQMPWPPPFHVIDWHKSIGTCHVDFHPSTVAWLKFLGRKAYAIYFVCNKELPVLHNSVLNEKKNFYWAFQWWKKKISIQTFLAFKEAFFFLFSFQSSFPFQNPDYRIAKNSGWHFWSHKKKPHYLIDFLTLWSRACAAD